MIDRPIHLLFLCTGNSARSILAEAIANERYAERLTAQSAGSMPKERPDPRALETLRQHGLDATRWRSKHWDELRDRPFDLVITLCDAAARESCPTFPGAPATVHWGLPDPPAADDPGAMFEAVFEALDAALARFAQSEEPNLKQRGEAVAAFIRELPVQKLVTPR